MMMKLMSLMFLSCRRAAELVDMKIHGRISGIQNFRLKLHAFMCKACMNYSTQSIIIDEAIKRNLDETNGIHPYISSPDDLKQHIFERIDK